MRNGSIMSADGKQSQPAGTAINLAPIYKRHVQGGIVRSGASVIMWFSCWIAYQFGLIRIENFTGVSFAVFYLILFNLPTLLILKYINNMKLFGYFSLFINFLEVIGYTAIIHFAGGIEALYLLPIYAALIIYVGVVAPSRLPFIIALFCVISFSLMVIFEYYGILPTYKIHTSFQLPWPDQIMILVVNANLLFVVAFISSYTANILKINRDKLSRQNEELRQALKKANEADRLKSEFLANMSHELRTPLNAIIGFSELLELQTPGERPENHQEFLQNINASGQHLLSIINDILDISKVEAGKIKIEPTNVRLPALLEGSLAMFGVNARKRRIKLLADIKDCPETIEADEVRLKQIIYNLLSNAVKFTPDEGEVLLSVRPLTRINDQWCTENGQAVSLREPDGHKRTILAHAVDIGIKDNGIGIKKEDLERIFKPFEQVDGSVSRRYEGAGLGLALAARLAELHGGYLFVESAGENRGSTFHCVLPA